MIIHKYFRGVRIPMLLLFVVPAIFMFFLYQQFNPNQVTTSDGEGKLLKDLPSSLHIIQV
jgi:hypothetical protein